MRGCVTPCDLMILTTRAHRFHSAGTSQGSLQPATEAAVGHSWAALRQPVLGPDPFLSARERQTMMTCVHARQVLCHLQQPLRLLIGASAARMQRAHLCRAQLQALWGSCSARMGQCSPRVLLEVKSPPEGSDPLNEQTNFLDDEAATRRTVVCGYQADRRFLLSP